MATLHEQRIDCPCCGEPITILMDLSAGEQSLIEDCQVCCQPMALRYGIDETGKSWIQVEQAQ
ncbi:MAG: CPXCG motif-containing cysteine-rich protein [Gammaproteobacteria bacterium]|nr:CPXCG motif-containing cysteine-rich protein [Gammaproteobacteria bacterium]